VTVDIVVVLGIVVTNNFVVLSTGDLLKIFGPRDVIGVLELGLRILDDWI